MLLGEYKQFLFYTRATVVFLINYQMCFKHESFYLIVAMT